MYFLAKRIPFAEAEAEYTWIYVGESTDISQRPLAGKHKPRIDANEANCLCLDLEDDAQARADPQHGRPGTRGRIGRCRLRS